MNRDEIRHRLIRVLGTPDLGWTAVDAAIVTEETSLLNDLLFDSLQLLDLVVAIENEYGFKATTGRLNIEMFDRIGSVVDFIAESLEPSLVEPLGGAVGTHTR